MSYGWPVKTKLVNNHGWYVLIVEQFFFLNQQFITRRAKADRGSYFVAMYKRNRQQED